MLIILFRAGMLMVFVPFMVRLLAQEFLPPLVLDIPGIGRFGIEDILATILFLFGALIWMFNPSGKGGASGGGFGGGSGCDTGCGSSGCGGGCSS